MQTSDLRLIIIVLVVTFTVLWFNCCSKNILEKFAPTSAVTAWKYPEDAVKLSEETINIVGWNPEGVTPFYGHQNPIGAEIWYARTPMDAIDSVPLSTTISSPLCCPSNYSTSTGCLCYGNAGVIMNNIKNNS